MRCTLTREVITLAIHKSLSLFLFGPNNKNITPAGFAMVDAKNCIPAFNIWPDPSAGPPLPPPVLGCLAMVRVTP